MKISAKENLTYYDNQKYQNISATEISSYDHNL